MQQVDLNEKRKQFLRIYDTEMRRELDIPTLLATLETVSKVFNNIIDNPNTEKYRQIPVTSKVFQNNVIDRKGAKSFILACGFHKKTIDSKEYWVLPNSEHLIHVLKLACSEVIDKRKLEFQETAEQERRKDQKEKEENSKRAEKAKRDFEEDRQNWDEKVEMTGGVKPSIALDFPDRERARAPPMPMMPGGMGGMGGMGGPPPGYPGGMGGPPPPAAPGGHVLGEEDDE